MYSSSASFCKVYSTSMNQIFVVTLIRSCRILGSLLKRLVWSFQLKRKGKLKIGKYQNLGLRIIDVNELMNTGRWESYRARSDSVGASKFSKWVFVFSMCFLPRHEFSSVLNRSCLVTTATGQPGPSLLHLCLLAAASFFGPPRTEILVWSLFHPFQPLHSICH